MHSLLKAQKFFIRSSLIGTLCILNTGCGLIFGSSQKVDHKNDEYRISRLDDHNPNVWKLIPTGKKADSTKESASDQEPELADYAFENKLSGAIISLNSVCNPVRDTTLRELTDNLLMGLPDPKVIYAKDTEVDDVHALDQLIETRTNEDSTVNIRTIVFRKEACTYDFMFIAKTSSFQASNADFDYFVKGFHAP